MADLTPADFRYAHFGASAGSNSTNICPRCGAVVYAIQTHCDWHNANDAEGGTDGGRP